MHFIYSDYKILYKIFAMSRVQKEDIVSNIVQLLDNKVFTFSIVLVKNFANFLGAP